MAKVTIEKKTAAEITPKAAPGKIQKGFKPYDFDSMFDGAGLPGLPEIPEIDPEQVTSDEVGAVLDAIKAEKQNRMERYREQVDSEFWFCVCFQSRKQKEAFLQALGWDGLGDKYVDGLEIASRLGVKIEPVPLEIKKPGLAPKSMRGMEVIE